ncbi:hypothetical protein FJ661_15205 [Pseudarthrobacter phenanthrenivorans]|uniref:Uncharacterized protein n=1 Tax=Pseudarthrobacter phenanthrenivorans (strain DSM 18606 / JCM 16027 / LMG 23796 / Sphe3) TaxID=930171 RepID=F0M1U0_PSEPM|nr:hypothetical protein [Pseudarthrobacter phenanthrenivorans]ADX72036.1 hypothetical protein Asphe3_08400 [Pseudarthrobacter phenanthrenivorans Sphe3]TPV49302.1 hypothetical protein FJ661_15205 [Pseudarthrobacter phenanthrenivorans]
MIEILQWSTLAICGLVAAARVPSAIRGENRTLFYIFGLMTLAILLSIQGPYVAIDQALGGINLANLLLRFVIFAAIYFVGIRVSRGFGADGAYRLITGKTGMLVLLVVSLVMVVLFFMMDTAGSSAGLSATSAKNERNFVLVEYYGAAGRAYPAFVSLALLPPMVRAVRSRLPLLVRVAAGLLALGGVAITLTLLFPVVPPAWGALEFVVNYTAVLCFVIGLTLIWAARVRNRKSPAIRRSSTEK